MAFNVLLYNFCEKQKAEIDAISKQFQIESKVNGNQFKYQQDQIERLSQDLADALQQVKAQKDVAAELKDVVTAQKDALLQEIGKRQQIENESKSIQTSLVDIKAEADAIKQDMKGWQKDYVSVLAQLDKKMDDSQGQIKSFGDYLAGLNIPELKESIKSLKTDIENISHPPDNDVANTLSSPGKKIESAPTGSQ